MDYLKEYIDALVAEQAQEDQRLAELVQAKMQELLAQVQQPWREAIRLRARSEADRKELSHLLRRGDPPDALLPVALRVIAALTGDEALAADAERYQSGEAYVPDAKADTAILRQEYDHLVQRIEQMTVFLGDVRIPREERERAMPQFMAMDERSRALRKLLDARGEP